MIRTAIILILFLTMIFSYSAFAAKIKTEVHSDRIYVPLEDFFRNIEKIKTLNGHSYAVNSVSFSPDGKLLASGSRDNTIILWDAATGEKIKTLSGHSGDVYFVSFSPDGKMLASGSWDRTIILWDAATGEKIKRLSGQIDVYSVSFSPNGKMLASGSQDRTIILWDVATGGKIKTLSGYSSTVYSVSFSPDGKLLASGSGDKTIILWDAATGGKIKTLSGHSNSIESISFSPDGKMLASGSQDRTIILWDAATGGKIKTLNGHSYAVNSVSFSPDGKMLASGSADDRIILWDTEYIVIVSRWQHQPQKEEFEKSAEYEARIKRLREKTVPYRTSIDLGAYDADEEGFKAEIIKNNVFIKAPREAAKEMARSKEKLYIEGLLKYLDSEKAELVNAYLVDDAANRRFAFGKHTDEVITASASDKQTPEKSPAVSVPRLSYDAVIEDANHNGILEGGENIALSVKVKNIGKGAAKGVGIVLSGEKTLLNVIGKSRDIGDIQPSEEKAVEFKGVLPTEIPAGNAELEVTVKESKGYSPTEKKSFRMAMKPAEITEKKKIISELIDVDIIPPKIENYKRQNSYAVIIGISNYRDEVIPKVKYARSDAETVAKYLENIGGLPKQNIKILTDDRGAHSDLIRHIEEWLPNRVKKDSDVFIYYAGHGTPDPDSKEAYLVPYDGNPDFKSGLYSLKRMYESLNKLPAGQVVVMLDSCFSGAGGRSIISAGARPIIMSIENPVLAGGKISVLAASSGSQISSDYDKVKHGLFTYYLLKGMKGKADENNNGRVELRELYNYLSDNVSETASIELDRVQTPALLPDIKQNQHTNIEITRVR